MIVGLHSLTLVLLVLLARSCAYAIENAIEKGLINEADDCVANACFALGTAPPTGGQHDLIRIHDSDEFKAVYEKHKFGVYVNFSTPEMWPFQIGLPARTTPMLVRSITIGETEFNVYNGGTHCTSYKYPKNDLTTRCIGRYKAHKGVDINLFSLLPKNSGQDFGTATGIYGGVANQIKFTIEDGTTYTGIGLVDIPLVHLCGRNLFVDRSTKKNSDNTMLTCEGTNMISYQVGDAIYIPTLEDLTCDKDGWKAGTTLIAAQPTIPLTVQCVESCKMELIEGCAGGTTSCRKPDLLGNRMLTCMPGFILYADSKVEKTQIECTKKSFENADKSINIVRTDPKMKAKVECLSKCDEQFWQIASGPAPKITPAVDGSNKLDLNCADDLQYTTLKSGSSTKYSAQSIVCDPLKGWRAADINNNDVFAAFDFVNKIEAGCVEVCKNRVNPNSCPLSLGQDCKLPTPSTDWKQLECGTTHILRYDGIDYIRKDIQCTKLGTHQPGDPPLLTVEFANKPKLYDMQCISNCAAEFVTGLTATSNQLTCPDPQIMIVDVPQKMRIFEALTCVEAVGWKTSAPGFIVDFSKEVKLAASCFKVCNADTMVQDVCDEPVGSPTPGCISLRPAYNNIARTLSCGDVNYRVFINDKQCEYEEGGRVKECDVKTIECKREGWFAGTRTFVDFKDPNVDITNQIKVVCKHKCSPVFVEDSCKEGTVVAGKTTCSKVNYAKAGDVWQMSCTHPSEIVVLEQEVAGAPKEKESFGTATCSNAGWKDDKGGVMFDLSGNVYKIRARCENLCHAALLQGTAGLSRSYNAETAVLTCTEEKEMLKFQNIEVYSDMTCSKDGWKTQEKTEIKFAPGTLWAGRMPAAECVNNKCIRDITQGAKCNDPNTCSSPDFSVKYKVSCPLPKKLLLFRQNDLPSPVVHSELICKTDGTWFVPGQTATEYLKHDDPLFDLFCSTAECTTCKSDAKTIIDSKIHFVQGVGRRCSRYECVSPEHHFVIINGNSKSYYVGESEYHTQVSLQCSSATEVLGPKVNGKQLKVEGTIGCIEHIPCIEHSPLDLSCTSLLVECDSNKLETKLRAGSQKLSDPPVKCDEPEKMYLMTGDNTWTVIDHLKCNKEGEWDAINPDEPTKTIEVTKTQKKNRKPMARVVCSVSDPTILPATTTEATPDPMTQTCHYCPLPGALTCDKCLSASDNLKMEAKNGVCTAKLSTAGGRFIVNDDKSETSELRCKKDVDGNYVWRDDKGKAVAKMAAAEPKLTDKMNVMVIVGIVVGSIVALGAIAGLIVYGYIRRKREAKRIEELKFKGLSQRIDTIIDKVSIEEPQTVRL